MVVPKIGYQAVGATENEINREIERFEGSYEGR